MGLELWPVRAPAPDGGGVGARRGRLAGGAQAHTHGQKELILIIDDLTASFLASKSLKCDLVVVAVNPVIAFVQRRVHQHLKGRHDIAFNFGQI